MSTDTTITRDEIVAIDTALAEAHVAKAKATHALLASRDTIHSMAGDRKRKAGRSWVWGISFDAALDTVLAKISDPREIAWNVKSYQRAVDSYREAEVALYEASVRIVALNERYTGWSRFFLVNNVGGHIHSSMGCSTCRPTTEFSWLPTLSGLTEAEAVAEHGAILCTVCFPSAPVEWTNGHEVAAAEKKADKCEGSGSFIDRDLPHRTGYYRGNWATCPSCAERVTLTSANRLRAHKPKVAS